MSLYIAIEGIDGAGTTTLSNRLSKQLDAIRFCEPFQDHIGGLIRDHLRGTLPLCAGRYRDQALANLFCACRLNNQTALVMALEDGHVVTDRCLISTWVYQASVPQHTLEAIHENVRRPDVCILIDLPPEEAHRRLTSRPHLEAYETLEELTKHRQRYLDLVGSQLAHRWFTVDGRRPVEEIVADAERLVLA